jgi:hypothetical protein
MKKRRRNWDKLEKKKTKTSLFLFLLSPTNFVPLALTYNNFFLMKFHTCPLCHHFTFSNSARIHNVFWVYVSSLPCITRASIKNVRKPNQFYFSLLFSFPAETHLTMVLNFDLRDWFFFSVLCSLLRETKFSGAILCTIHLTNLWQANYSNRSRGCCTQFFFAGCTKTVSFLIWKENKKHGQGSCMHQHLLNFHHIFTEHLND